MRVNSLNRTISFGTTSRLYKTKSGDDMGCNSWLFRNDIDWNKLAKYEIDHFKDKDKVNIVMFAASDGSEAYTKIISLHENCTGRSRDAVAKFFPIKAYDTDSEILKAAKSGHINSFMHDRIELDLHCKNYEDYFSESKNGLIIPNDKDCHTSQPLFAKKILTENVEFSYGDMFEKVYEIKDDSNTIVMCRNILGYFWIQEIEKFLQAVSKALKPESLFVIGNHDFVLYNIKEYVERYCFREVMKNVFKKI